MSEEKCFKCSSSYPADSKTIIACEICGKVSCKQCSDLCATEIRVIELSQRNLIYACSKCKSNSTVNKILSKSSESIQLKLVCEQLQKCVKDLEAKLANFEQEKMHQSAEFHKTMEATYKKLEDRLDKKISMEIDVLRKISDNMIGNTHNRNEHNKPSKSIPQNNINKQSTNKVRDSANEDNIIQWIVDQSRGVTKQEISAKKVKTYHQRQNNNHYLIGVPPSLEKEVYSLDFWPIGVAFDRFNFRIGQKFLDNPRQNEGTDVQDF
nr:unnamed protein product [Callosobruchus analis]